MFYNIDDESKIMLFFKKFKFILISIGVLILFVFNIFKQYNNDNNYFIDLKGKDEITIYIGDKYVEFGYYGYDSDNNDLTKEIVIENMVDSSKKGTYKIVYKLYGVTKVRIVNVVEKPVFLPTIKLAGESNIYLLLGEKYEEYGYVASDTIDGDLTDKVIVINQINNTKIGKYDIIYSVTNSSGLKTEVKRVVNVINSKIKLSLSNSNYTNENVNINVLIEDDYFDYLILPDGEKILEKEHAYNVSNNGTYKFILYNKVGMIREETINVNNIDKEKPTGTCSGTYGRGFSNIYINAKDNIGISKYVINGKTYTTNNITLNNEVSSPKIMIYDRTGNVNTISCNLQQNKSKLEMHFIASGAYDDAILIRTDDKTILIDSGTYFCRTYVTPYLKALGVKKIDLMIGSHLHYNHIQAQADILNNFQVDEIIYPDDIFTCHTRGSCHAEDRYYIVTALNEKGKIPTIIKPGTKTTVGEMELYFLAPEKIITSGSYPQNANSFIFILKFYNNTFMFTGDAPMYVDSLSKFANSLGISMDIDLLKYPHHGNYPLNDKLLQTIKTEYVVVPNYNHSYFPASSDINLLKKYNVSMYRQSDSSTGSILVTSDGDDIKIINNVTADDYKR